MKPMANSLSMRDACRGNHGIHHYGSGYIKLFLLHVYSVHNIYFIKFDLVFGSI